ncbi:DUF6167 family protein [Streptomyces sp. UH6]|uniref:DUF6167 family protein n=1 Tax=Streptomyces sp. UH6 TaxID=2748379 RepID=UPI0015D47343|nr:DUF6167 family protein [Streptomyces sp. UH6]NYV73637.1 hypothetical protein [Streptomyces sp. UH6]
MFRRAFWFSAGAAAGVWATTKVNRKLKQLTPESLAAQAANKAVEAGHRLKDFALDVRDTMAQREAELGEALGLRASVDDVSRPAALEPGRPAGPRPVTVADHRSNETYAKTYSYKTYSHNRNEDH